MFYEKYLDQGYELIEVLVLCFKRVFIKAVAH